MTEHAGRKGMSEAGLSFNWVMKEPDDVEGRDGYDICTDDEYPDILASGLGRDEAQFILSGIAALRTLSTIGDPVKVAEALPELVEALKECQKWLEESPEGDNATGLAIAALAKLKAQP